MIPGYIHLESPYAEIISAIVLSNACHLASVFVLYKLTILCCNHLRYPKNLALIASMLHILSPAGLFLTAPYSESLFSLLTFSGTYLYACSLKAINSKRYFLGNFLVVSSAAVFFAASTVRSNGLLNGLLFLFDFIPAVFGMLHGGFWPVIRVMILGIGGVMVGSGVLLPQFIAWQEFCGSSAYSPRPWCLHLFPSIYTWVQGQYW
jgi:phosphatidylinositol glycan class V